MIWHTEPDYVRFLHFGLYCIVARMPRSGHLCGYAAVSHEHPLFGLDYDDESEALLPLLESGYQTADGVGVITAFLASLRGELRPTPSSVLEVHQGITYASEHEPRARRAVWESGRMVSAPVPDRLWWFDFDCAHAGDLQPKRHDDPTWPHVFGEVYRDFDYVLDKTRGLAEQLASVKRNETQTISAAGKRGEA